MRQRRRLGAIVTAVAVLLGTLLVPLGGGFGELSLPHAVVRCDVHLTTVTQYYGGTFDAPAYWGPHFANGSLNQDTVVQVWTPEEFRPFTKDFLPVAWNTLTLDQSVRIGTQLMINQILANKDPDLWIGTESQSSIIAGRTKQWFLDHPDQAPPASMLTFYTFDNPSRPNGGVTSRFAGISIPFLGITATGPTPQTQYKTYDFGREYEGFVNFPAYLIDLPADVNALIGIGVLHGRIGNVDLNDSSYVRETAGSTTYITAPTNHLPMLVPVRTLAKAFGATDTRLIDAAEPILKVVVDAGYPNNDPMDNQGVFIKAQVGMPTSNVVRMLQQLPAAVNEAGIILRAPKSSTSKLATPVSTMETQPVVSELTPQAMSVSGAKDELSPKAAVTSSDNVGTTAVVSESKSSNTSKSTPKTTTNTSKPAKKKPGFNPGAAIKHLVDAVHNATHPKKHPVSSGASTGGLSSSGSSGSSHSE